MAKTVIGLEVTEESVRAAEVQLGRRPQLVSYGEVPLPSEAARDSEVLDQGAVAVALRQLWTGVKFRSKEVVLGVASRRILVPEIATACHDVSRAPAYTIGECLRTARCLSRSRR